MNLVICTWCYVEKHAVIEAADVIPEIHFTATKQRIAEVGICEAHKSKLFPEALFATGSTRPQRKYSKAARADVGHRRTYKSEELPALPDGAKGLTAEEVGKAVGLSAAGVIYHQRRGHITPLGRISGGPRAKAYLYSRSVIKTLRDQIANKGQVISDRWAAKKSKPRKAGKNAHSRRPKVAGLREVKPESAGWFTPAQVQDRLKLTADQLTHHRKKGLIVADGYWHHAYMFSQKSVDALAAALQQ
jgi:hypothetical protein